MTPTQPEMPNVPLADQPWFIDLLAGKGFYRSSPTTFTNGKASIQVEGTKFLADPGTGDKAWNSDLAEADRDTIKIILQQILKTPPFLTEADLTQERAEKQLIERALTGIAATIKEGPDTGSGVQLRRFLWSLYNSHHLINLWPMTAVLIRAASKPAARLKANSYQFSSPSEPSAASARALPAPGCVRCRPSDLGR
jgi:hypothetical protein